CSIAILIRSQIARRHAEQRAARLAAEVKELHRRARRKVEAILRLKLERGLVVAGANGHFTLAQIERQVAAVGARLGSAAGQERHPSRREMFRADEQLDQNFL